MTSVLHYTGHLRTESDDRWPRGTETLAGRVQEVLRSHNVCAAFGSLACGADLLVASQIVEIGARLHAFVPVSIEWFLPRSVAPGGREAHKLFERLLAAAFTVTFVPKRDGEDNDAIYRRTGRWAMGAALSEARASGARPVQLAIVAEHIVGDSLSIEETNVWKRMGGRAIIVLLPDGNLLNAKDDLLRKTERKLGVVSVADELRQAQQAAEVGMREAAVLLAARILEGLTRHAAIIFRLASSVRNTHTAIELLKSARWLNPTTFVAAHTLRLLGNDVRHAHRAIKGDDHWLALALLNIMLRWHMAVVEHDVSVGEVLGASPPESLELEYVVLSLMEARTANELNCVLTGIQERMAELVQIVLMGFERAIDLELWDTAEKLLWHLNVVAPDNHRARELHALMHSRRGNPEEAVRLLAGGERVKASAETMGILAGAYKRIWMRDGNLADLRRAEQLYRQCWEETENSYVGVNAAACALWLGHTAQAKNLARAVLRTLQPPQGQLGNEPMGFYDAATLAELHLLAGDRAESGRWEQRALEIGSGAPVRVFREQIKLHLRHLNAKYNN